jgi:hypothetical protein
MNAKRPIVVVLDGPPTPAWQAQALRTIEASPSTEVVEVRLVGAVRRSRTRRVRDALERHLFLIIAADALSPVDLKPSSRQAAASLVVWLSERPPPDEEARELLWIRHGGVDGAAEDAFARALVGRAATVASTILLRRGGRTFVAAETISPVRPFSELLSRTLALWKLAAAVPRVVERLPELTLSDGATDGGPASIPSGVALLLRAGAAGLRAMMVRLLYRRPWSIRVRERGTAPVNAWGGDDGLVRWGDARIYADPFLFEHDGRHHLFCEEVPHDGPRGVISHTELRLDGATADPPKRVLEAPYHLSYPFVFVHQNDVFMIPETSAARRVELYRAVAFPHEWEREAVLLEDINAADATFLVHGDRLWLFAAVAAANASSLDELHLFWSEAIRGPWHPHPCNPVVSDVRCARPAGPIQRWDGQLVRPCQDGSRRYGWAISFREIDALSVTAYAEHEVARLEPGDVLGARATHAYSADSRFEAIDLRRRRLRLRR